MRKISEEMKKYIAQNLESLRSVSIKMFFFKIKNYHTYFSHGESIVKKLLKKLWFKKLEEIPLEIRKKTVEEKTVLLDKLIFVFRTLPEKNSLNRGL